MKFWWFLRLYGTTKVVSFHKAANTRAGWRARFMRTCRRRAQDEAPGQPATSHHRSSTVRRAPEGKAVVAQENAESLHGELVLRARGMDGTETPSLRFR